MKLHGPDDTQHLLELGRNGSGKTVAGCWHLSRANWDFKPWIIFDTKGDELIEEIGTIEGVKHITFDNPAIEARGLHIIQPLPNDNEQIERFLWSIHARENIGIYIDEGYMMGKSDALNALLTQGRSKHIPIIILSQRPAWLSRFCFSEASFFQIFQLTDRRDRKTVQEFVPFEQVDLDERLQPFHSVWYDVKHDRATLFRPVPPSQTIVATFRSRLAKMLEQKAPPRRIRI